MTDFPPIDFNMVQSFIEVIKGDDVICWQVIPDKRGRGRARFFHGTLEEVKPRLIQAQQNGCGIFVTVNRTDGKGRRTNNILQATAAFVDGDGIPLPTSWPLPPNIIVQRDAVHWHAYWLLKPVDDLAAWTITQKRLANFLGTDTKISDPPRVMRVPGFIHQKGDPVFVKLIQCPTVDELKYNKILRHTLDEINHSFPVTSSDSLTPPQKPHKTQKLPQPSLVALDLPENIQAAVQYLQSKAPIAVEGEQGDPTTLQVGAWLKDLGISQQKAVELLWEHWNPRCNPPWDREGLRKIVQNAFTYCTNSEPGSASQTRRSQGRFERCLRLLPLTELKFAFNTFSHRPVLTNDVLPWKGEMSREITDEMLRNIRVLMISDWEFDPGKTELYEAAMTFARLNPFHPVVDYLNRLRWDNVPRLDRWLSMYMGVVDSPYTRTVGAKVLLAAVKRVQQPGCKFDTILVLEGKQGTGKSTAIKILASEPWYSDGALTRLNDADAVAQIQSVWIYELGEMVTLSKGEVDSLKAFASRAVDRARLPYGRAPKDFPRQGIFIGTTNSQAYLRDETGNRRIWPVQTTLIDTEGLRRDRDQLWAEAADRWLFSDDSIELDPSLWPDAAQEQEQRLIEDPWEDLIKAYLDRDQVERVLTRELLAEALHLPSSQQHQAAAKRVRGIMAKLGWEYRRALRVTRGLESLLGAGYLKEGSLPGGPPF